LVISIWDCFSVRYIQSAALLCRLGYQIEREFASRGKVSGEDLLRHEVYILNSVLSSVAFLESTINELYADAADDAYFFVDEQKGNLLKTIGERWRNEKNFDRAPLVNKYQKILLIGDKPPFYEGDPVFSDIRTLIEIRNYLMHYKREWIVVQQGDIPDDNKETQGERLEKILRNKFAPNPLAPQQRPFFPDTYFGHGCAEWAVNNSLAFTDDFFKRLDLPPPYEGIKNELNTK
jgi:hypothetical protein